MLVYIGNPTPQNLIISYRFPESRKVNTQPIRAGGQVVLSGKDVPDSDANAAIGQLARYGLRRVSEISTSRHPVAMVYSVGKPLRAEEIKRVVAFNKSILAGEGKLSRQRAAIAASALGDMNAAAENLPPPTKLVVEVEEVTPGDDESREGGPFAEGVVVDNKAPSGEGGNKPPRRSRAPKVT